MTAKQTYEAILRELSRRDSPDMYLDDYNYFINRGIMHYVQQRVNVDEYNAQVSDDLQALRRVKEYLENTFTNIGDQLTKPDGVTTYNQAIYRMNLPSNFMHVRLCSVTLMLDVDHMGFKKGYRKIEKAKRLTDDMHGSVLLNAYSKPSPKNVFYSVVGNSLSIPANWASDISVLDARVNQLINKEAGDNNVHNAVESATDLIDNESVLTGPGLTINYGNDSSVHKLQKVQVIYLKTPAMVKLSAEQADSETDTSQVLEFPDHVCLQIIKEAVKLFMVKSGDPSVQGYVALNTDIPKLPGSQ
jgi:hypothetical protein